MEHFSSQINLNWIEKPDMRRKFIKTFWEALYDTKKFTLNKICRVVGALKRIEVLDVYSSLQFIKVEKHCIRVHVIFICLLPHTIIGLGWVIHQFEDLSVAIS